MGHACRVLVDCGCTDVVMSSSFASELGIAVESLPSGVTLANGSEQPVSRTAQAVPFSVGHDYTEDLQFTVTAVTYDIILSLPWLESGNKQVD
jgi:predicted aspartyl protease